MRPQKGTNQPPDRDAPLPVIRQSLIPEGIEDTFAFNPGVSRQPYLGRVRLPEGRETIAEPACALSAFHAPVPDLVPAQPYKYLLLTPHVISFYLDKVILQTRFANQPALRHGRQVVPALCRLHPGPVRGPGQHKPAPARVHVERAFGRRRHAPVRYAFTQGGETKVARQVPAVV